MLMMDGAVRGANGGASPTTVTNPQKPPGNSLSLNGTEG